MYIGAFQDTLFVDMLEYFGWVTVGKEYVDIYRPNGVPVAPNAMAASISGKEEMKQENQTSTDSMSTSTQQETNASNEDIERAMDTDNALDKAMSGGQGVFGTEEDDSSTKDASKPEEADPFLVEFLGEDDPRKPWNWSFSKKTFVIVQLMVLTCINYMGSSIYTPGQEQIQHEFHVGHVVGTLNLSMYVLGYAIGPIIFSPLSEVSSIGRMPLYLWTFILFTILQVACALVRNIAGLVILRFITGILCSPVLATGGASVGDVCFPRYVPRFLGAWAVGAVAAPVMAPILGAAMVVAKDWRWIFWLMLFMCGATLLSIIFFFPETSHECILHRRAKRLRKLTGDDRYYTKKEKQEEALPVSVFIKNTLWRPIKMIALEPIILAFDVYIALCYGAFYLFFEAFPIVFAGIYHFTLVEVGLAFLGFCVGCVFAYTALIIFQEKVIRKKFLEGKFRPELFLILAMCLGWCLPFSLFFFGWTARIHWILPIIAELFFVLSVFNLFQATFSYLAVCYPEYVASVFAGNGLCRGAFAAAFPLFGKAMYDRLSTKKYPVAWGSTLIGFITVVLSLIPFVLYKYGPALRARSRFSPDS
ncbi:Fluconazole resistance protein 1 [Nakaseomyces glabratus]|nr:Fluconazole resistance protein 1 [Nakaseomyces glabratus]KTB27043.1 Fluconazole resistance protein 1 [Nakaseomyces glabratus]